MKNIVIFSRISNKEKVFFTQVQKPEIKQPAEQQLFGPLKLEAPSTETDITSQKDLDFNLAK